MYKKKYKSVYISILTVGFYIFNILLYIIYIFIIVIYKKVYFEKKNWIKKNIGGRKTTSSMIKTSYNLPKAKGRPNKFTFCLCGKKVYDVYVRMNLEYAFTYIHMIEI